MSFFLSGMEKALSAGGPDPEAKSYVFSYRAYFISIFKVHSPLFGIGLLFMVTCILGVGFCIFYFLLGLGYYFGHVPISFVFYSMVLNRRENKIEWNGEDQEKKSPWCENTQRPQGYVKFSNVLSGGGKHALKSWQLWLA